MVVVVVEAVIGLIVVRGLMVAVVVVAVVRGVGVAVIMWLLLLVLRRL